MENTVKFKFIDNNDAFLEKVLKLSDKNKATLGLIPREGFVEQAKRKQILVAYSENDLCGFILFRINKRNLNIAITQLCVEGLYRGKKIGDLLLDELKTNYKHFYRGISLTCREDYSHAKVLWGRNGFKPLLRRRSRSVRKEFYLVRWFFDFGKTDLFSQEQEEGFEKIKAVLDTNILISWSNQEMKQEQVKSIEPLLSDWLDEFVSFYYPSEFHLEIYRDIDIERKTFTQNFIKKIKVKQIKNKVDELERIKIEVVNKLNPVTDNDLSDAHCISEAIAAKHKLFITNDIEIIRQAEFFENKYNLKILSPYEFALFVDKKVNDSDYISKDLSGLGYEIRKVKHEDINILSKKFLNQGEKEKTFKEAIRTTVANPRLTESFIISNIEEIVAFWSTNSTESILEVALLRIKSQKLEREIFQQVLSNIVKKASSQGCLTINIANQSFDEVEQTILISYGFEKINDNWIKFIINEIIEFEHLYNKHPFLVSYKHIDEIVQLIKTTKESEKRETLLLILERKLWPIKFIDIDIPVFIVPIKPYWASQLFDYHAATQKLFRSDPLVAWKRDNIYYRSFMPNVERVPARILWYASVEKGSSRQKSIVATSYLDEINISDAKTLFKQFEKYGVYKWADIAKLVSGEAKKIIKALKFSDTEVFDKPITYKETKNVLDKLGYNNNNFVSPMKVGKDIFVELYTRGKG